MVKESRTPQGFNLLPRPLFFASCLEEGREGVHCLEFGSIGDPLGGHKGLMYLRIGKGLLPENGKFPVLEISKNKVTDAEIEAINFKGFF
jgi:hypothetical protein